MANKTLLGIAAIVAGYAIVCDGQRPRMKEVRRRSSLLYPTYEPVEGVEKDTAFVYELFPERR